MNEQDRDILRVIETAKREERDRIAALDAASRTCADVHARYAGRGTRRANTIARRADSLAREVKALADLIAQTSERDA